MIEITNSKEYKTLNSSSAQYRLAKLLEMSGFYSDFRIGLMYHIATEEKIKLPTILNSIKWNKEILSNSLTSDTSSEYSKEISEYNKKFLEETKKSLEYYEKEKIKAINKLNSDKEIAKLYKDTIKYMKNTINNNFSTTKTKEKNENKISHNKQLVINFIIIDSYRRLKDYNKANEILGAISNKRFDNKENEIFSELKGLVNKKDNISTAEKLSIFIYDLALEDFGLSSH